MKLLFKQRFFSWFDSYDIYYENGAVAYTVKGQLSWGHKLNIYDMYGNLVGTVKEVIFRFLPRFELYVNGNYIGCVKKKFRWFANDYAIDFMGWQVNGNFLGWDYTISDANGTPVARIGKEVFNWTDTYVIDVANPQNALYALMFTLAIDAEKCSSK